MNDIHLTESVIMSNANNDLPTDNVSELLERLLQHHHPYTRTALAELFPLAVQVARKHGERHPELAQLASLVGCLRDDMDMHLMKEENILFPYIRQLADSPVVAPPPFGTIANPIQVMRAEHDTDRAILEEIMNVTGDFTLPPDACTSFSTFYQKLRALVEDILQHMDLENNRLFPLALELEKNRLAHS